MYVYHEITTLVTQCLFHVHLTAKVVHVPENLIMLIAASAES